MIEGRGVGSEIRKNKNFIVGLCLVCSRNSKVNSIVRIEKVKEKIRGKSFIGFD